MLKRAAALLACVAAAAPAQDVPNDRGWAPVSGTKLYYEIAGAGPPLVLIHGGWLNSSQWDEQFAALSGRFRVLRYDLRGHGRSLLGLPDSGYTAYEDLAALLRHVGMERPHMIGVSAGAQAAIDFALQYPGAVRSLVLGASPLGGHDLGAEYLEGVRGITAAGAAEDLRLLHERVWAFAPFRVARTMPPVQRRLNDLVVRQHTWAAQRPGAPRPRRPATPPAERLGEIRVPTLVLVGAGEMPALRGEADLLAREIPAARLMVIPGAGHFPNLEQPKRFLLLVTDWLQQQERHPGPER